MSLALKIGVPVERIIEQLGGIGGETQISVGQNRVKSLPDAIAKGLRNMLQKEAKLMGNGKPWSEKKNCSSGNFCPSCGKTMALVETCEKCLSGCGFSRC